MATGKSQKAPVLKVTLYERVSSFMVAIVLALMIAAVSLFVMWMSTWESTPELQAEMAWDVRAGFEDGDPEEDFPDLDTPNEEVITEESLETVIQDAETASEQAFQQLDQLQENMGSPQRGEGTGRPLGVPGGTGTGLPREQRWYVRFADQDALEEYAKQLDFFKIEIGVLFIGDNSMTVLSNLSSANPRKRTVSAASLGKETIHFNWKGGARKEADLKLLAKAGIQNAPNGVIFHFYPRQTQQLLLEAERSYRNRPSSEIRRTYFVVKRSGRRFEFQVTRQSYF